MRPLTTPTPCLNGNSRASLMEKADEIRLAVSSTVEAIRNGCDLWHGRNFQTEADYAQKFAQEAWHQRLLWLDEFDREVAKLMMEMK